MKTKKANAAVALLAILFMLAHVGYSVFSYLTFYYNPFMTKILAIPFVVLVCIHAVLGMMIVFTQSDGTAVDKYPRRNLSTVLQRLTAALMFPLLILHINTFSLLGACAERGYKFFIILIFISELLFFAVVITHVAVSFSKAFITLGWLSSPKVQRNIDRVVYVIGAVAFVIASYSVLKGQMIMFLG